MNSMSRSSPSQSAANRTRRNDSNRASRRAGPGSGRLDRMPSDAPPVAAPLGDVTTDRLVLRRFARDDVDGLARVFSHPEVWHYPYGRAFDRDETLAFVDAQLAHWDEHRFGLW